MTGKKRDGKTSKGERPNVNRSILKDVRKERTELSRTLNAWNSWKKGQPTPKIIQRILGVDKKTLYKSWNKYIPLKGKDNAD